MKVVSRHFAMVAVSAPVFMFSFMGCAGTGNQGTQLATNQAGENCVWVELLEIYDDPRPYDEQVICTEGILQESFPAVFIAPHILTEEEALFQRLDIDQQGHRSARFEHGDRVRARGRLTFFHRCYDFHVVHGGEMGDMAVFCGPPDVPMFLEVETLERLTP